MGLTSSSGKFPKILVVSNNCFSRTSNNGKTLASFFYNYPKENIAQIFFYPQLPDFDCCSNYFRVTDNDVVRSFLKNDKVCGSQISNTLNKGNEKRKDREGRSHIVNYIVNYNSARLLREVIWANISWKSDSLLEWLDDFSPEVIFFCAGDSGFAYDIVRFIKDRYNAKSTLYITDDYILPRTSFSPFYWLRRNFIFNKMKHAIKSCDLFFTISPEMKKIYKDIFGKESIIAINMSESNKIDVTTKESEINNSLIRLVYAGGLHYKRYLVLSLLGKAIAKYNSSDQNKKKVILEIYCTLQPSKRILKKLNIENASKYCGGLSNEELNIVLNSCDIPVHVESFDKKSISSTKLSISTKIPEYLSLGKCILAIGPSIISSMKYLSDIAFCITDQQSINNKLPEILNDAEKQNNFSLKARQAYEANHNSKKTRDMLVSNIIKIYEAK